MEGAAVFRTTTTILVKLKVCVGVFGTDYHAQICSHLTIGPPSRRKLTCIVYLNENWKKGDGGELVLWPFLQKPIVIPPLMDRLVMFRSDLLLHRVLPSTVPRYCFTVWVDGLDVNSDKDVLLTQYVSHEAAPFHHFISFPPYFKVYLTTSWNTCFVPLPKGRASFYLLGSSCFVFSTISTSTVHILSL